MLILSPTDNNIQKARKILQQGRIIIYPTDTLYGLGADIFNTRAVKKIFSFKKRNFNKPISVMVSSLGEIKQLAHINKKQEQLIRAILPGPFTILLKRKNKINKILTGGTNKIGIRIPDSEICQKLSKGLPITTTSANISGIKPVINFKKLSRIFSNQVDLVLKGQGISGRPSIVIDLTKEPFKILRYE